MAAPSILVRYRYFCTASPEQGLYETTVAGHAEKDTYMSLKEHFEKFYPKNTLVEILIFED